MGAAIEHYVSVQITFLCANITSHLVFPPTKEVFLHKIMCEMISGGALGEQLNYSCKKFLRFF